KVIENPGQELIRINCFLKDLVRGGRFSDALHQFKQLHSSHRLKSDHYSVSTALTACAGLRDTRFGAQLHAYAKQSGLEIFIHIANSLLSLYAKSRDFASVKRVFGELKYPDVYSCTTLLSAGVKLGEVEYARNMFDLMPQSHVPLWNALITGCENSIEAFELFRRMHVKGLKPDHYTLASVLSCCSLEQFDFGKQLHSLILKTGFMRWVSVMNSLLTMYFDCRSASEAFGVYEDAGLEFGDEITHNAMINGLVSLERYKEALLKLKDMLSFGLSPTESTFVSVMGACLHSQSAHQVHCLAIKTHLSDYTSVSNAAISMYSSIGDLEATCSVFSRLKEKDLISWNAIIASYVKENLGQDAAISYIEMQRNGIAPDEFTIGSLLPSSDFVEMFQAVAVKNALILRVEVLNALLCGFSRNGEIERANEFFREMKTRNLVSWNAMISGFVMNGLPECGLEYFYELLMLGFQPNEFTLSLVLSICSSISDVQHGKQVHGYILKHGYFSNALLGNTLIALYSKSGSLDLSVRVFNTMTEKDTVSWNSIISAFAQHGEGKVAVQWFEAMKTSGHVPLDKATFTAVLSACSRSGLVSEGIRIFRSMVNDHGFEPDAMQFSTVVGLLGRGGFLDTTADGLIKNGGVDNIDSSVWWSILSCCAAYGHVQLGSSVAELILRIEKDEPSSSVYVLLSNLYANAGEWEGSAILREAMKKNGIMKRPGNSWITS
ncbi:hypothetical protein M569_03209, partial [Genlisea aurea]